MRVRDIVVFNKKHPLQGNIGVIKKVQGPNITVGILIPPDEITYVQCRNTDLFNTRKKFPYKIILEKDLEVQNEKEKRTTK